MTTPTKEEARSHLYSASFGYSLAMRVMQSDLYQRLDGRERSECDELIARGQSGLTVGQPAGREVSDEQILSIARSMQEQPWGIGSRREDAVAFARAVLAAGPPVQAGEGKDAAPAESCVTSLGFCKKHQACVPLCDLASLSSSLPQGGE